jgi:UPF0755 protein
VKWLPRNRRHLLGTVLLVLGLVVLVGGLFSYRAWIHSPIKLNETVTIQVKKGMTGREIGQLLEGKGVIDSVTEFRWALWFKGAERDLGLGTVRLHQGMTMDTLIEVLREKSPLLEQVSIPEGWPSWRIFTRLSNRLDLPRHQFKRLYEDSDFIEEMNLPGETLEGYMFPDTYNFSVDAGPRAILAQMIRRFHQVSGKVNLEVRADSVGLSVNEAVTLASIIQREVSVESELELVSGVYHNRLERGMKLQADPTVLYELKNFDHPIFQSTLNRQSPYNTYRRTGLPPTPICNPGQGSLRASVTPADVPYFYFVSRGDGTHVFSETLQEHQRAVQRYRR